MGNSLLKRDSYLVYGGCYEHEDGPDHDDDDHEDEEVLPPFPTAALPALHRALRRGQWALLARAGDRPAARHTPILCRAR
ncbi:MAG: hypothetical protein NTV38_11025, partial [Chloroflexi bacterium]|nr:hypothetical protein [Chloroflexota bacterium]